MKRNIILFCLAFGMQLGYLTAQDKSASIPLKHGTHRIGNRTDETMQRWREYGLGQFIHWGVYAIPGGHWEGKTYGGAAEWIRSWSGTSAPSNWQKTYDNLYHQFNPTGFNADKWAKQATEMGTKYVIFTTKHHDGFCMWPSKFSDYTIANTPYKKDIVKEVVDAYDKVGIDVYLYFSVMDWSHKGWRSDLKTPEDSIAFERFKQFTRNQLLELLTNYPTAKGLWFDGTWDKSWSKQAQFADELETEMRALRPGLVIGSRFRADDFGKRHFDSNGNLIGDYEQVWERRLPGSVDELKGHDWDCVMTIPPNQWGYNSDWSDSYIKTSSDLIEILIKSVSMNGNLVINFGPDGKGNIRPEETRIAHEIGEWMQVNSEAIYGCKYSGLKKPDCGYYTQKGNKLYLTVFNKPVNNIVRVAFPNSGNKKPIKSYFLSNQKSLSMKRIILGLNNETEICYDITLPSGFSPNKPFVIVLELLETQTDSKTDQPARI